uniref:WGS project CBME000000000 data, contig CS3487_c000912 n=1 Tax=Fusarium pseudograminearum CS3487 TaxID=1318458 RepID=A0A096PDG7_FUSPS|nr:unnamed protein product [Fusarium pseudograminearum CS3487]
MTICDPGWPLESPGQSRRVCLEKAWTGKARAKEGIDTGAGKAYCNIVQSMEHQVSGKCHA